ncbi:MAG: NADH:ubiquinone oxidoreductase subunit C [Desulfatitalea sp. BRH_c12]|nr:MAG: NADH:ubiquinone oxidoreductase subunit C [Desulfatitalea sp. BRH_c12]
MPNRMKSLLFATLLCVVCSLLLTAASTGLKARQQQNMEVDRQKNILKAFGIIDDAQTISAAETQQLYRHNVRSVWVDESGRSVAENLRGPRALPLYIFSKNDTVQAYVVPIDSRGLWGTIHGYLAIENDGSTIRGFTVYQHQETPGLGGEIESRWFRKNFAGKKIVNAGGDFVSVRIAKGSVDDRMPSDIRSNYVDGISGATLTGKFLSEGMQEILEAYEPIAVQFRQKDVGL